MKDKFENQINNRHKKQQIGISIKLIFVLS